MYIKVISTEYIVIHCVFYVHMYFTILTDHTVANVPKRNV